MTDKSFAYNEGIEAGRNGFDDLDNPYHTGTDNAMDWEDGRLSTIDDEEGETC